MSRKNDLSKSVFLNSIDRSSNDSSQLGYKAVVDKGEVKIVTLNKPGKPATYDEVRKAQLRNR